MINFSELLWKPRSRADSPGAFQRNSLEPGVAPDISSIPSEETNLSDPSRLAAVMDPHGPGADRFRLLRMRLLELRNATVVKSVIISSPLPGDGKSTVSANLATALAEGGKRRVLLVEADLHRPSLATMLGVPRGKGLAECIEDRLDPMTLIHKMNPLQWYLLQAGIPQTNASELAQSEILPEVLEQLSSSFDWIIIDSPPVLVLADTVSIARHADTCLLVVRAHKTPQSCVDEAMTILGPKQVFGIVFNSADELDRVYYEYAGAYQRK